MTRVMCFGTFDLLHLGHIWFLSHARTYGDELYVVVSCDARRTHITGRAPMHTQRERMAVIKELRSVTRVIPGHTTDMLFAVKKFEPQVIVLGHDQTHGVAALRAWARAQKNPPRIVRLKAYRRGQFSSTRIREKICG